MKDYLIWAGEKYEADHPGVSWDEIMELFTTTEIYKDPRYSIDTYLKETRA